VPVVFSFAWFSIFGDTALYMIMEQKRNYLIEIMQAERAVSLFALLGELPASPYSISVALWLISGFLLVSLGSGALVVSELSAGYQSIVLPKRQTLWVFLPSIFAILLMQINGLASLQAATVLSALPFAFIILMALLGMWRALIIESH